MVLRRALIQYGSEWDFSSPALGPLRTLRSLLHPFQEGSFGKVDSELQQLAINARSTPGWILGCHAKDQIPYFFADSPSAQGTRYRKRQFQYHLNPARCQRTMVSGVTITAACFHFGHRRFNTIQSRRSKQRASASSFVGSRRKAAGVGPDFPAGDHVETKRRVETKPNKSRSVANFIADHLGYTVLWKRLKSQQIVILANHKYEK